jgi:type III restriction enzyme
MSKSVIGYDRELPEIPGRQAWERPDCFLVKDKEAADGWRIDNSGRRPSKLLLVKKLRTAVDRWRADGYPGASDVTKRLFSYWFDEDHEIAGFAVPFRYRFCLREGVETLVYLAEVQAVGDAKALIDAYAEVFRKDLFSHSIEFETRMDRGKTTRLIRRYVAELDAVGEQELPPEDLWRYAFKMATGSGKTWVIAMVVVWSHFHKRRVPGSRASTNFLIVAPNVIVYQRLEKDFGSNRIFNELPLIPPEWKGTWNQKVILRGESAEPDPSGNLFLTNVQQLYQSREKEWTPANAVDALLGRQPVKDLATSQRSMLERLKGLKDLVVINDEAHHVHDEDLQWSQSLMGLHKVLPKGLSLWLDFSATPKDPNGMYFPWTICDYPLAQAVEDRIVKAPLVVTKEDDPAAPKHDPEQVTKENVGDKYGFWIQAAVKRWRDHFGVYGKLGTKPVLFIMAETNAIADGIGDHLLSTKEFGFKRKDVLVIHTDKEGEVSKKDLDVAREAARDIDKNDVKAIISVMMLREGWDVRNVSVVLGLRPYSAKAEILPEQVIGRGLRLMQGIGPDQTQTLEVLGTPRLLDFVRKQLEAEGVGVGATKSDPVSPIIVAPVAEKMALDIAIPLTKPTLTHNIKKLADLAPLSLDAIYDQADLAETFRVKLKLEFATTETEVHQDDVMSADLPMAEALLGTITNKVIHQAKLGGVFAQLYPSVRVYVSQRCFGKVVDLEEDIIRSHLRRPDLQDGIAKYLARKVAELIVERREIEFENKRFRMSDTKPFGWRRNLPAYQASRTIFNYVATYNPLERAFGIFLDKATDVLRFASLGTTEQGESGTQFKVDYLKPGGAIGFYHPDWVVVQEENGKEINWIIETKGRVWEGTKDKDAAIRDWCARVSAATGETWRYARVNQVDFESRKPKTLAEAVRPAAPVARLV